MVTTAIALVAGIALVVMASTPSRFDRVLRAWSRPAVQVPGTAPPRSSSERTFMHVCRMLTLGVGGVCLVLGALGVWSRM